MPCIKAFSHILGVPTITRFRKLVLSLTLAIALVGAGTMISGSGGNAEAGGYCYGGVSFCWEAVYNPYTGGYNSCLISGTTGHILYCYP